MGRERGALLRGIVEGSWGERYPACPRFARATVLSLLRIHRGEVFGCLRELFDFFVTEGVANQRE